MENGVKKKIYNHHNLNLEKKKSFFFKILIKFINYKGLKKDIE